MRRLAACSFLTALVVSLPARSARAEPAPPAGRWSIGTSLWMIANALPRSPHFAYLEADAALGERSAVTFGALTWRYDAPIGIPYGDSLGDPSERYPGFVRSVGAGAGWRQRVAGGLAVSAWAFHLLQLYTQDHRATRTGYQLFLQARAGWRWQLADPGPWLEPALAFNAWPVELGRPRAFRERDDRWPSYFLLEPWLNAGWSW